MEGYWIRLGDNKYKCSSCGKIEKMNSGFLFSFCPHCGAQIDKESSAAISIDRSIDEAMHEMSYLFTEMEKAKTELDLMKKRKPMLEGRVKSYEKSIPVLAAIIEVLKKKQEELRNGKIETESADR